MKELLEHSAAGKGVEVGTRHVALRGQDSILLGMLRAHEICADRVDERMRGVVRGAVATPRLRPPARAARKNCAAWGEITFPRTPRTHTVVVSTWYSAEEILIIQILSIFTCCPLRRMQILP